MSKESNQQHDPLETVDDEFAGHHGTTATDADESEMVPESPGNTREIAKAVGKRMGEGNTLGEKIHRGLKELDQELAGEYERKDEESSRGTDGKPA